MKKTIANITLALLLGMPVFSLITTLLPLERQKINLPYQLAFPGDLEDQQDDSDPTKDNENNRDSDFIMETYSLLQLPLRIKQHESRQERLFKEHHREVGTPPPKS
jgi:hypothetical protein